MTTIPFRAVRVLRLAATDVNGQLTLGGDQAQIEITNLGPNNASFRTGVGAQVAGLATDNVILPNTSRRYTVDRATGFAAICAATQTATLVVVEGGGV